MSTKNGKIQYVVVTDLDGTLLDHHNYDWQPAQAALNYLSEKSIPVVINTSKTSVEVLQLQKNMNLNETFIVENGSAIFIPDSKETQRTTELVKRGDHWIKILGLEKKIILESLQQIKAQTQWKFEGFSDWSTEEIMSATGLSRDEANDASQREFSEPLVWNDSEENYQQFCNEISQRNLKILKGGRFIHIIGETDKGQATRWLKSWHEMQNKIQCSLIVLGDGPNDIDMLNVSDYAVLVKSPAHDFPIINRKEAAIFTKAFGPEGWNEAINMLKSSFI